MDELKLGSEWRQHQQRHGWIGIGVNDDSVNIVMDELELELNDDSNKLNIEAVVKWVRKSKEPDEYN